MDQNDPAYGAYYLPPEAQVQMEPAEPNAMGQGETYLNPAFRTVAYLGSMAGGISGAYHGYKRNDSIGWAIVWGILGGLFWPISIPVSLAQGFGEPRRG